uniref:UBA domain-containing protein n=1 Tax=Romanomermis culicivorax TaxID=13658 RepID=A0A915IVI0_ROMCU
LEEISSNLNKVGYACPPVLAPIANIGIKEIAVGPNHIAFLLEDGRVCRVSVNIFGDRLEAGRSTSEKSGKGFGVGQTQSSQPSGTGAVQSGNIGGGGTLGAGRSSGGGSSSFSSKAAKIRRVMQVRDRMRGVIASSRPLIPVSAVPEELIVQAQVVLQGKSRDVIVRELQRTNLDVNQAVNNLLSRDDDDGDDFDDAADSYMPEDLISLLDSGLHGDQPVIIDPDAVYGDEVWGYPSSIRRRAMDKDKYADSASKDQAASKSPAGGSSQSQASNQSNTQPAILGAHLDFWMEKDESMPAKFDKIGAMYSELVAVGRDGKLYQWKWESVKPAQDPKHPKMEKLNLKEEILCKLSCSLLRTTLATVQGKLCSFVDESVGPDVANLLDVPLFDLSTNFVANEGSIPAGQSCIQDVCSSHYVSCVKTKNNNVYWWGTIPFNERRKLWERTKCKSKKYLNFDTSDIAVGAVVRLKTNPLYQAGSVALTTINGYPQLGVLMESAWTLSETCRFQIIKDPNTLPPGTLKTFEHAIIPDTVDSLQSARTSGRKRQAGAVFRDDSSQQTNYKEEAWNLSDIVFVEDNLSTVNGTVVKVDGPYCGVVFPDNEGKLITDPQKIISNCRLFRKEDLVAVTKSASGINKSPETLQKEPKVIPLNQKEKILDVALTNNALLVLHARQNKIVLCRLTFSGKVLEEHTISNNSDLYLGVGNQTKSKLLNNYGEDHILVILDGNGCFGPYELPRLSALGLGVHPMKNSSCSARKNRVILTAFNFAPSPLIEHVLHCDYDSVNQYLHDMERTKNIDRAQQEIVETRLDNNQNILHACVAMGIPPTNKQNIDNNPSLTSNSATAVAATTASATTTVTPCSTATGLESSGAVATRAIYDAKWEQMISGARA